MLSTIDLLTQHLQDIDGERIGVHILSERDQEWRTRQLHNAYNSELPSLKEWANNGLNQLKVHTHIGPPSSARHLSVLPLDTATCIIILSEAHETQGHIEDPTASDARNLNTMITLRGLQRVQDSCVVVCELLDPRSEYVVMHNDKLRGLGEYFYSNKLETAMFAMASENRRVFNALMVILQPHSAI
jgi:hypothetical protein